MSWRLTSPKTLKFCDHLRNCSLDEMSKTAGTWTGESYVDNDWGFSCGDFDGTDDKVAHGDVYNGVKSVTFLVNPDTTTEQFLELAFGIDIDVTAGTIGTTGWTSPTVYVDRKISSTLVADKWQFVGVTSATGINANAVNLGVSGANYGDIGLGSVKFYSCQLTWDEMLVARRMIERGL